MTSVYPTTGRHLSAPAPADRLLLTTLRPAVVVFDFDGTLADTSTLNTDAARATLADLGLTVPEPWLQDAPLADIALLRQRLYTDLNLRLPCTDGEFVTIARRHWLTHSHQVREIPRVTAVARHLATTVPAAVASANDGRVVDAGLAAIGLAALFQTVVAREHVERLKPDPECYLLAAAELATEPARCLAFENTDEGVTAALAAGLTIIDVRATTWSAQTP
ncbi:HAD family phosphatase [Streptomyces sp. NBC_00378]|uniref:HAD family hydrolase n=1 Tax=unclassified Streptomyces TaxID=2593676 RepID=UPI0022507CEE|nr:MULTISPECIES: HAD family phosphatase [unclassified Streptomyces]MCX5114672.1 HAD family phosphatase [Streptomyces sp. NBC_00378]